MLEHAYYSVISPEGCASILWKGSEHAPKAAAALKFTSRDLHRFGIIDEIIPEPLGGAHRDHREASSNLKSFLLRSLRELKETPTGCPARGAVPEVSPDRRLSRHVPQRRDGRRAGAQWQSGISGVKGSLDRHPHFAWAFPFPASACCMEMARAKETPLLQSFPSGASSQG